MGKVYIQNQNGGVTIEVNSDNYIEHASRTNSANYPEISERLGTVHEELKTLLTGVISVSNVVDSYKKFLFYNKPVNESVRLQMSQIMALNKNEVSSEGLGMFLNSPEMIDILHGTIGLITEAGEVAEAILNALETNDIDLVNLGEELGDFDWYKAIMAKRLGITMDDIMTANIQKLAKRFPEGFSYEKANNRNLEEERESLESNLSN